MMSSDPHWRSPDGVRNAEELRHVYSGAFRALSEVDRLGHRILARVPQGFQRSSTPSDSLTSTDIDAIVAVAMLRRSVMLLAGIRVLLENSVVESAKPLIRTQWELRLVTRYLVYGSQDLTEPTFVLDAATRQSRARYFFADHFRRKVYRHYSLLDGRLSSSPPTGTERKELQDSIDLIVEQLKRDVPTEHDRLGEFRCRPKHGTPRYHDHLQWFSFGFEQPQRVRSLRALAEKLNCLREYNVLYDALSGISHARGLEYDLSFEGRRIDVLHPHLPDAFQQLCFFAGRGQLQILKWIGAAYEPTSSEDWEQTVEKIDHHFERLDASLPAGFFG